MALLPWGRLRDTEVSLWHETKNPHVVDSMFFFADLVCLETASRSIVNIVTLLFQNSATKSKRLPVRSLCHLLFQLFFVREGAKINALPGRKILMDPFRA